MVDRKENYKFDLGVKGLRQFSDKNNMYQTATKRQNLTYTFSQQVLYFRGRTISL